MLTKQKVSLSQKAYDFIRQKINTGELSDADIITESNIGEQLNMSRTPVRKALAQLEMENYVRCADGVGYIVRGLSTKDLADIYEVRTAMETLALKSAIERLDDKEIDALLLRLYRIRDMYEGNETFEVEFITKVDFEFHHLFINRAKNNYVKFLMKTIDKQIERYHFKAYSMTDTGEESTRQHIAILEKIKARDFNAAKTLLESHIAWSFDVLCDTFTGFDVV